MLPGYIEMLILDRHLFVEGYHVRAFVVVGPSEEKGQELYHRRV